MATATILHVGDDICRRIPVIERAGLAVVCSEQSVSSIAKTCTAGRDFAAISFQNSFQPVPELLLSTVRQYSRAPLILFDNPCIEYDTTPFDLVVPAYTSPDIWLKSLKKLISDAVALCASSQRLREDCALVRDQSRELRAEAARNRKNSFDMNAFWSGGIS